MSETNWLKDCEGFLIDLDGTMYRGNQAIPCAREFVEWLNRTGRKYLFVTNNSSKLPRQVADKLSGMGIPAEEEHVFTSSQATAMYIKDHAKLANPTVYAIGEEGVVAALEEAGCRFDEESPDYVVVGIDRQFSYEKLKTASFAVQKGAIFLGTNADKRVPTEEGLAPGAGSLSRAVATASGVEPVWIGKPEARMVKYSIKRLGLIPEKTVIVGDNLETDILAGINAGIRSVLVLTGYSGMQDAQQTLHKPDLIVKDLAELISKCEN
ncbi:TIGR01457 family HAD-type hydrolase [Effusibacillus lacus]|uniref:Acid sugar phosphatase n=1 Tax=Effusibacillus lacus TaxID=1348429 RepID=A0A292YL85_9BACL|nr:TIGR01457 family HAD-type hydrolase [Effusibacillus lacus]TCS68415.1 4-nitrophenyl phosphatase [Effusibacillus lacus]GAX89671.1 haloacid dehalogenase [Effusibacillus lacus]